MQPNLDTRTIPPKPHLYCQTNKKAESASELSAFSFRLHYSLLTNQNPLPSNKASIDQDQAQMPLPVC